MTWRCWGGCRAKNHDAATYCRICYTARPATPPPWYVRLKRWPWAWLMDRLAPERRL
jgi:hypothetical protein